MNDILVVMFSGGSIPLLSFRLILGSKRQEKYKKNTRKHKKIQEKTIKDKKRQ
jgi:hypothetical protein